MTHRVLRRSGFTLIELLVVVAIIAVLMALLLPAVQKVREAANKIDCGKNLNQMAMGCHMFHHDFNWFPSAGWANGQTPNQISATTKQSPPQQSAGWAFQILPYIEQKQIYDQAAGNAAQLSAQIPIYFCRSRRAPTVSGGRGLIDYCATHPQASFAGSDTAGNIRNTGSTNFAGLLVPTGASTANPSLLHNKVVLNQGSIPTGSSNVVLISEKYINQTNYSGAVNGDRFGYVTGWPNNSLTVGTDTVRRSQVQPQMDSSATDFTNQALCGSAHPSTFQVVMGDRTVKQIRYSILQAQWLAITNRKNITVIDWSAID